VRAKSSVPLLTPCRGSGHSYTLQSMLTLRSDVSLESAAFFSKAQAVRCTRQFCLVMPVLTATHI